MNSLHTALVQAHAALDAATVRDEQGRVLGWVGLADVAPEELAEMVRLQARLQARQDGLRLHVLGAAEASDARAATGASDTESWAARAGGTNRPRTWGALGVAQRLESTYPHVRAALTAGEITEDHARIIVRACEKVRDTLERLRMDARVRGLSEEQVAAAVPSISPEELAGCEQVLVDKALRMPPRRLAAAARRVLAPLRTRVQVRLPDVDPDTGQLSEVDLADVVADDQLREAERQAELHTYLTLEQDEHGWWSGRFCLPPLAGQTLRLQLEHRTSPRRAHLRTTDPDRWHPHSVQVNATDRTGATNATEQPVTHAERLGAAFCELLEHLPTDAQGRFGTNDVTIVVHVDQTRLREGLGSATLASGEEISISQTRRLACNAHLLPMVLSGDSVPLDLGRERRLFTRHQALALSATHDSCAAQGCDRPFAWCELHHLVPWSQLGTTDLDNAVPLCGHHHRRIHDPLYHHHVLPDRSIAFEHRWPSRHSPSHQRRALRARAA